MMVLRKLAIALLSAGVMLPGLGHALAVSDLKTKSALGEPFAGEIELSEIGDLNADEIKASMATQEDFDRLGIERVYFLNELKFDVVVNQGGRSYIRVTSPDPTREPYLDFVIRVAWPGNARLQEVTALLDPPVTSSTSAQDVNQAVSSGPQAEPAPVPVVETPAAAPVTPAPAPSNVAEEAPKEPPKPVVATPPSTAPSTPKAPRAAAVQPQPAPSAKSDSYRTQAGDTMSKIAQQFRPNDAVSAAQAMVAIQRANPAAFGGGNINQLKRDQVLQIPSEAQMRELSAQEAVASVREQSTSWRSATVVPAAKPALEAQQVNATAKEAAVVATAPAAPKPEMKLLGGQAGKAGSAAAGKDHGVAKAVDVKKIDENKAKADAAKADKAKLTAKVGTLGNEVKANDQQIAVQNAKLAELQSKLKEQQEAKAAAAPAAPKPAPVVAPVTPATAPAAAPDAHGMQTKAAETASGVAVKPLAPAVKPPVQTTEEPEADSSSLPLIGGVAAVLALLGGGFWWNRKRHQQTEEAAALAELEASDTDHFDQADHFNYDGHDGHQDDHADALLAGVADLHHDDAEAGAPHDRVLADPMEEVEQYLAFERYPQAVGFLNKAITTHPERADLRLKLLEIYTKLDDYHGFIEQEAWFEHQGDLSTLAHIQELKAMLTPPAKAASRDDAIAFERHVTASSSESDMPSLEDLEMDFNSTVSASSPVLQAVKDTDLDLPDLDHDFSFDTELSHAAPTHAGAAVAAVTATAVGAAALDELEHFSFSKPAAKEPTAHEDDLSFELDHGAFDATHGGATPAHSDHDDFAGFEGDAGHTPTDHAGHDLDFSLDDAVVEKSAGSAEHGLGDLVDFDSAPELKEPEVKTTDDDLSFSLDDLELDTAHHLDGDFSVDHKATAHDLDFDETVKTDSALNDAAAHFDSGLKSTHQAPAEASVAVPKVAAVEAADLGMDDEFDFLADTDENATKLDLARAYIDMGDMEGARDILQEVLGEGNATQKDEAKGLLAQVG
jgi:pilus assembly protein FimV